MKSLQLSEIKKKEEEFVACICDCKTPAHGASLRNVLDVFWWLVHSCVTRAGAELPEKLIQWFHCDEPWKVPGISCCAAVRFVGQACNISCPPLCGVSISIIFFNPWKLEVRRRVTFFFFLFLFYSKRDYWHKLKEVRVRERNHWLKKNGCPAAWNTLHWPFKTVACVSSVFLLMNFLHLNRSVYVFFLFVFLNLYLGVFLCRACQSSGPVSFKLPTSVNQNRNKILRPSLMFSSSSTPPVENRNTSVFLARVSFLFLST